MPLPLISGLRRLPIVVLGLALAACGSDEPGPPPGSGSGPLKSGMFANHPIEGLEFSSGGAPVSLTDRQGTFSYRDGAPVRFAIGGLALGSEAAGAVTVTPLQLAPGAADTSDPRVTNLARLLQTLDADCDVDNGIRLTPAARSAGSGRSIDFNQSEAAFGSDAAVQSFIEAAGAGCRDIAAPDNGLVSGELARQRLDETLTHMETHGGRANRLPTADAGFDIEPNEGTVVNLSGMASDDDGSASVQWTRLSGPEIALTGADTLTPSFTAPSVESNNEIVFVFRLTATDDDGGTHSDDVTVSIQNGAINDRPIANAGPDQNVVERTNVVLDGSNSRDPEDGQTPAGSFQWTQQASDTVRVTLGGADGANPWFTAPAVASADLVLNFNLVVRDRQGLESTPDTVTVTVHNNTDNLPPISSAGPDLVVDEGKAVVMNGSASSDPENGPLSYQWLQDSGPAIVLSGADTVEASFTAPDVDGDQNARFKLVVTDDHANTGTDEIMVFIHDRRTIAIEGAGAVAEGDTGTTTTLDFKVTLSPQTQRPASVQYTTQDETATAGRDYVAASGTLEFAAGETEKTLSVTVNGDNFEENDETLRVVLFNAEGAGLGNDRATGTILDDDDKGLLRAGAARRSITPAQAHVDGINEPRIGGAMHRQKFNLGGFGINPLQNFPDPIGAVGGSLTEPASRRVFTNSRGQEENTHVRAFVVEQPGGARVAFVMMDAIGAGNVIQKGLKDGVIAATRVCGPDRNQACFEPQNILFGQSHSHAGADLQGLWGGVPQDWISTILYAQAAAAVSEALANLRPARLMLRQGQNLDYNNYRRPRYDLDADADGTLTLLQAVADEPGTPIGSLLQYNAHPTSINTGVRPRTPHADYIQGAMDWLESSGTGTGGTALYYNGPIGDASPSGSRPGCTAGSDDGRYGSVRCRGEGMAEAALRFEPRELAPTVAAHHVEVTLPITNPLFLVAGVLGTFNRYYDFLMLPVEQIPGIGPLVKAQMVNLPQLTPTARTLVSRVTLGGAENGLEIVTIPGEATNSFGQYIRGLTANKNMMLLGLTQNSFGYILPEEEFNYVDPSGRAGFVAPFTGYEEFVSLGPLTAPLLRIEGYNKLFPTAPAQNIPPFIAACLSNPLSEACVLNNIGRRLDYIQRAYARQCRSVGAPEPFCALIDPETPFYDICIQRGLPEGTCRVFGTGNPAPSEFDRVLSVAAVDAQARGCDLLDTSHCLFPFPSDHFTVAAPAGSPQSKEKGGTGKRINFNPLAMPRNTAGKPIDPTEWNRNDGFSPGQMIVTYVPGLAANTDGTIPGAPPITDIGQSLEVGNSSVVVIDTATGLPHPVWAEMDLNANTLLFVPLREVTDNPADDRRIERPLPGRAALIIRPAVNFKEGHRYVVVLRKLQRQGGGALAAQTPFRACRDKVASQLPPVQSRCAKLEAGVFPVLANAGVARDASLYLAWDFTTASANNNIGRLRHMRDDAFIGHLGQVEDADGKILSLGRAPAFTVDKITLNPGKGMAKRIEGTITIPSYVTPVEPSPLEHSTLQAALNQICATLPQEDLRGGCESLLEVAGIAQGASVPPSRLFYNPLDSVNPADPQGQLYGDGLPDSAGAMTTRFICQIPPQASPGNPARPGIYGHGLLDSRAAVTYDSVPDMAREHNFLFCAVDLLGFATGDLVNVLTQTLDLSLFPVIPDATQQGLLNYLFLARLLRHPQGFAAHPAFQQSGAALFDRREVFYHGYSQGGIVGGAVVAASKDIQRGSLGVPGMNYSTLLTRATGFDLFSVPIYLSYPDELDRNVNFALIQMLWDRSENNGYAHHITDNSAFKGPANQVLLHPAFGDHQVTMWSADVMARTLGAAVADAYQRQPGAGVPFTFATRQEFFDQRHPDNPEFFGLPLVGRDTGAAYDSAPCAGTACRSATSAIIQWDEGRTAPPPIGNVVPREAGTDPHSFPRRQVSARCQKSHFLHSQGRLIDARNITSSADCPALPPPAAAENPPAGDGPAELFNDTLACLMSAEPQSCLLAALIGEAGNVIETVAETVREVVDTCNDSGACDVLTGATPPAQNGPVGGIQNATCANEIASATNRSYQVLLTGHDGETISFQVLEPAAINCAQIANGAHPLILEGHGYGGSRRTSGLTSERDAGYAVISIDQRGFGQSSGTVRVMDPEFEGRYLVQILDWAEQNLDYLAWRDEATGEFITRPANATSVAGGVNLVVGAIGGSYGGGYQLLLLAVDARKRLDAIVPDITWHDLRFSLNPGDTIKSLWNLALAATGEVAGHASGGPLLADGQDPLIKEMLPRALATNEFPRAALDWFRYRSLSHWCAAAGLPSMPYPVYGPDAVPMLDPMGSYNVPARQADGRPGFGDYLLQPAGTATHFQGLSVLLTQGMVDTLFNFNEAWWNAECLRAAGAEVNLLTHNGGHQQLSAVQALNGLPFTPGSCPFNRVNWFNSKLKPDSLEVPLDEVCFVLNGSDRVTLAAADVLAPQPAQGLGGGQKSGFTGRRVAETLVPNGLFGATNVAGANAIAVPLGIVAAQGVLAGIPFLDVMVATPGGVNELAQDCGAPMVPTVRLGCDSIVFVGLGLRAGSSGSFQLIDHQVTPLRGLGRHRVDMVGIAERLPAGSQLALLLFSQQAQFVVSFSRDVSIPAVTISGAVKLPIYGLNAAGQPDASLAPTVLASDIPVTPGGAREGGVLGFVNTFVAEVEAFFAALQTLNPATAFDAARVALYRLIDALRGLIYEDGSGSLAGTVGQATGADSASGAAGGLTDLIFGSELGGPGLKAGVGVVDMTPDVGYGAGQMGSTVSPGPDTLTGEIDPYATHKSTKKSYGVQSRLSARALVIEGSNGKRLALVKTDNYLAQDLLMRRVGQILDQGRSGIAYEQILHHASHNHSSAYSSTLSVGPWLFTDAYDARFFENQARKIAQAIELAAQNLKPARMGGTQLRHVIFKGNVPGMATAQDGTPAGYPLEYNDHGLVVLRFDQVDANDEFVAPIAVWVNWGQHPESLGGGYDLHSADFLGPLERFVEQDLGAPLVFSQGDVGSAERSGNTHQRIADDGTVCGTRSDASGCAFGQGVLRDWMRKGYVQAERGARFLADDVVKAWHQIGDGQAIVPFTRTAQVDYLNYRVPGPLSHPYPSISNCNTAPTVGGDIGVPVVGLPNCARTGVPGNNPVSAGLAAVVNSLKVHGVPVPDQYDAPSFLLLEENLRLMLQAFRIGDVLLVSSSDEPQSDLILNLESRLNLTAGDIYSGFDWACLAEERGMIPADPQYAAACARQKQIYDQDEFPTAIPGSVSDPIKVARMRAQVHNDARGWDAPEYAPFANSEPAEITRIKGNFTKEEIQDFGVPGYKLPVGIGHAGDYNGYTVSYREYMNRDHYRKALTAYGPHTADYIVTRLVRMAAELQGGPRLVPEAHDALAVADEARQEALARLHGQATSAAYEAWQAGLSDDLGPAAPLAQPADVRRFQAATFTWRGGATAADNPLVRVQREFVPGSWLDAYDMSGEVQTRVKWPVGPAGVAQAYAGQFSWEWTANFEAYSAFPARLGATPTGNYRFCVSGVSRKNRASLPYAFCSQPFAVQPWNGVPVENVARSGAGNVSFTVPAIVYPRSYTPAFPFVRISGDALICNNCSFRPWAERGRFERAEVQIAGRATPEPASCTLSGDVASCSANINLAVGETAMVRAYDQDGNFGLANVP